MEEAEQNARELDAKALERFQREENYYLYQLLTIDGIADEYVYIPSDEELLYGDLPENHVYQLGKPSTVLRSAGLPDLPAIISSSIEAEIHPDYNKVNNKSSSNPKNAYSYEATKIELIEGTLVEPNNVRPYPSTINSISTANLLKDVEKSYQAFMCEKH